MKQIFTLIALFAFALAFSQSDPQAKKLLDEVSNQTKSYTSIKLSFTYSIENKQQNLPTKKEKGTLILSGSKYNISLMGINQICDGVNIWRIMPEDEVIETSKVGDDDEGTTNPAELLTMYEKGFRYQMIGKGTFETKAVTQIKLIPVDPKKASFSHIEVGVDEAKKQIVYVREFGKNGTTTTYSINTFESNLTLGPKTFKVNPADYPGYEIVDVGF
jgi:outer membrane lipoprotein-sorting protein